MKSRLATLLLALLGISLLFAADDPPAIEPEVVIEEDMHEIMESLFELPFDRLKAALKTEEEPTLKSDWVAIRSDALIMAQSSNLLLARSPHPDDTAIWSEYSVGTRDAAKTLYEAAGDTNWVEVKAAFPVMIKQCNLCHERFADDMRDLKP